MVLLESQHVSDIETGNVTDYKYGAHNITIFCYVPKCVLEGPPI